MQIDNFIKSLSSSTHSPEVSTRIAVAQEATLQGIALCRLDLVLHLVRDVEAVDIQQAIESSQVGAIQAGHGEAHLQVLAVELQPSDLGDVVLREAEDAMGGHLEVVRVVHVLGELEPAQHVQLRQVDHDGDIALCRGGQLRGVDYPNAFDGRGKAMREVRCLNEAVARLEQAATAGGGTSSGAGTGNVTRDGIVCMLCHCEGIQGKVVLRCGKGRRRWQRHSWQRELLIRIALALVAHLQLKLFLLLLLLFLLYLLLACPCQEQHKQQQCRR